ncbi:MAG: hypothetical protein SV377_04405 [Halobacteria archaeon]|nr:hypothetical protein [Halobacteria archaeon]
METQLTRRRFLKVGSIGMIALAGCSSSRGGERRDGENSNADKSTTKTTENKNDTDQKTVDENKSVVFVGWNESQPIDENISLSNLSTSSGCKLSPRIETMC